LDASHDGGLKRQIELLEQRNKLLERDKVLLMEKCEASQASVHTHATGERDAVKQVTEARKEAERMKEMFEQMKSKFEELASR
jgi:hypothetical protein